MGKTADRGNARADLQDCSCDPRIDPMATGAINDRPRIRTTPAGGTLFRPTRPPQLTQATLYHPHHADAGQQQAGRLRPASKHPLRHCAKSYAHPPTGRSWSCVVAAGGATVPLETGRPQPGGALPHRRLAAAEPLGQLPQAAAAVLVVERISQANRDVLTRGPAARHRLRSRRPALRATHRGCSSTGRAGWLRPPLPAR